LGSGINIPIRRLETPRRAPELDLLRFAFRFRFVEPVRRSYTVLAVNLGGAVIPTLLSLYLIGRTEAQLRYALAVAAVAWIVHRAARPVPGFGIAVPLLVPPLVAAAAGLVFVPDESAPAAYVAGTLGCLVGADLLNLGKIAKLGAPVASIGGAGTFDGVFLTGVIAVLLA
jgi:uncharacterized membrane protein